LRALFGRYRLAVPENPWPGKIARYATLRAACEAGVEAEIANGAMYSRLLKATRRPDMLGVFHALKDASQQRHLPAFQRGVERTGNAGTGWGATRRRRGGNRA
ncbi:MAG TPA: DUF2202 domain-containing protein, partial [Nitrospiria bacterium]|nr:DUF2202 domain-containing protein [Nitrospiria bacterium]